MANKTPRYYVYLTGKIDTRYADERGQRIANFINESVRKGKKKQDLFLDMADALIEKQGGEAMPPQKVVIRQDFEALMLLMEGVIDALHNAQSQGFSIGAVNVDHVRQQAQELWDTSHIGKEGSFFDD